MRSNDNIIKLGIREHRTRNPKLKTNESRKTSTNKRPSNTKDEVKRTNILVVSGKEPTNDERKHSSETTIHNKTNNKH